MNNIWIPAYKILANTVFWDITSFTYDLDSIKLVLTDDNNKKISVEANEVINFFYDTLLRRIYNKRYFC